MAFCSECGSEFAEGVKFCGGCGANLDGTTEVVTPHCSQCGVELAEGIKFCNACGAPTANAVVQTQNQPTPAQSPVGQIECPYCHSAGTVVVQQVKKKKGVSPGKVTAAVLTSGISLIGTGLAKKAMVTQLTCASCGMTWEA